MTWFGGFRCYSCSWPCGLTCEARGGGRSSQSWCETTVDCAWGGGKKKTRGRGWIERWKERIKQRKGNNVSGGEQWGEKRCDTRTTGLTCEGQVWKIWVVHKCRITNRFMCLVFLKLFFWLSNNCCIGSLRVLTAVLEKLWRQSWGKGVYVCLCVVWRSAGDVEMRVRIHVNGDEGHV